jgi:hypothetical protein
MSTRAFDAFTRHAVAVISRRTSLVTLGGAALVSTVAKPGSSEAKKSSGKTCKKKAKKKCNQDAAACRNVLPAACFDDAECIVLLTPCCDACSANGFLICLHLAAQG